MRTTSPIRKICLAGLAVGLSATLVGCGGGVRSNPTPWLSTLSQRKVDRENMKILTKNENARMARQDWDRLWLQDRPSRLTREPVPR